MDQSQRLRHARERAKARMMGWFGRFMSVFPPVRWGLLDFRVGITRNIQVVRLITSIVIYVYFVCLGMHWLISSHRPFSLRVLLLFSLSRWWVEQLHWHCLVMVMMMMIMMMLMMMMIHMFPCNLGASPSNVLKLLRLGPWQAKKLCQYPHVMSHEGSNLGISYTPWN